MNTFDLEKRRTLQWAAASVGSSLLTACGGDSSSPPQAGYLYAMTNASQNGIVQMRRDPDTGALSMVSTTLTTGAGSNGANPSGLIGPDPLVSQNSLVMSGDKSLLFAVNAGDNSLSVFSVDTVTGTLTLKKRTANLGANLAFPNSVAYNNGFVYVSFAAGTGPSAQHLASYKLETDGGLTPLGSTYHLQDNASPTQVSVTPGGQYVLVNAGTATTEIHSLPIQADGSLGMSRVLSLPAGYAPFAGTFFASSLAGGSRYLLTSVGTKSVFAYPLNADGTLGAATAGAFSAQNGPCWIAVTPDQKWLYVGNGAGTISSFSLNAAGNPAVLNATAVAGIGVGGDLWISGDGKYLYVNDLKNAVIKAYGIQGDNGALTPIGTDISLPTLAGGTTAIGQGLVGI